MLARLFARPANVLRARRADQRSRHRDAGAARGAGRRRSTARCCSSATTATFLDNIVTSTLAFEGDGRIVEYVGGYEDYLRQSRDSGSGTRDSESRRPRSPSPESRGPRPGRPEAETVLQGTPRARVAARAHRGARGRAGAPAARVGVRGVLQGVGRPHPRGPGAHRRNRAGAGGGARALGGAGRAVLRHRLETEQNPIHNRPITDGPKARFLRLPHRRVQRAAVRHVRGAELGRAGAFGLLGLDQPGFWVLGAGLELGYLLTLATNARFQRWSRRSRCRPRAPSGTRGFEALLGRLDPAAIAQRYEALVGALPLDHRPAAAQRRPTLPDGLEAQADSLGRLSWMFLRLLVARRTIRQVLGERRERRRARSRRSRRSSGSSADESLSDGAAAEPRRAARDPRPAPRSSATEARAQARLHRRRARAHPAAGRADSRAGGALDRSRAAVAAHRRDHRDARRHRPVDPRSAAGVRRDGGSADRAAAARRRRARAGRVNERRACRAGRPRCGDLFRSGSAAQFLLHGNVFDVVPHGGKLLSLPGLPRAGDVRQLRRRAALRPQPRRARDARRRGLGRLAAEALGRESNSQTLTARAGLGARADRSLSAAHAEPAGAPGGAGRQAAGGSRSSSSSPSSSSRAATRCSSAGRSPPTPSRSSAGPTIRPSCSRTSSPCCSAKGCTI